MSSLKLDLESQNRVNESLKQKFAGQQEKMVLLENSRFNEENKSDSLELEIRDLKEKIEIEKQRAATHLELYNGQEAKNRVLEVYL